MFYTLPEKIDKYTGEFAGRAWLTRTTRTAGDAPFVL
jgi:hypothetical protein